MTRRLLVIDPSILHAEEEGVAEVLEGWPGDARVLHPALVPGDGPRPGEPFECDGVVVMGSAASVHDDRPHPATVRELKRALRSYLRAVALDAQG